MKKTKIKCFYTNRISPDEFNNFKGKLDSLRKRHSIFKDNVEYFKDYIKEVDGYVLTERLSMYKFEGKGKPVIIDNYTGLSFPTGTLENNLGITLNSFKACLDNSNIIEREIMCYIEHNSSYNDIVKRFNLIASEG